jgi:hypothetical protein
MNEEMTHLYQPHEKDRTLAEAFARLKARGVSSAWASSPTPYSALRNECRLLLNDTDFMAALQTYLRTHTGLSRAVTMLFTFIAMSARARWQDAPVPVRGVTARGWFLGRWVPTFLIVDGPIGRFVCGDDSPLRSRYGPEHPLLSAARDFLKDRLFYLLRNGFAHWAFDWEVVGGESYVVAYDWERDLPTAKMHQSECDAYHIITFALVEVLDEVLISQRAEPADA